MSEKLFRKVIIDGIISKIREQWERFEDEPIREKIREDVNCPIGSLKRVKTSLLKDRKELARLYVRD